MAYRGRILVELCTLLDSDPLSKKIEAIPSDDILVVEVSSVLLPRKCNTDEN